MTPVHHPTIHHSQEKSNPPSATPLRHPLLIRNQLDQIAIGVLDKGDALDEVPKRLVATLAGRLDANGARDRLHAVAGAGLLAHRDVVLPQPGHGGRAVGHGEAELDEADVGVVLCAGDGFGGGLDQISL